MADTDQKYSIILQWGILYEDDESDRNIETYRFDTREELNAFMEGVEAAIGWSGYQTIEDSRDHQDPSEPLPL